MSLACNAKGFANPVACVHSVLQAALTHVGDGKAKLHGVLGHSVLQRTPS